MLFFSNCYCFNNLTFNVNSGGAYPINANITVQIKINGGNIAEINIETDTPLADNFSIGNTFTILGTDFGQGGGINNSLTFELTRLATCCPLILYTSNLTLLITGSR